MLQYRTLFRVLLTVGCAISLNLLAIPAFSTPAMPPPPPPPPAPPAAAAQPPAKAAAPTVAWGKITSDGGQTWHLTKPEITIGSAAGLDIVLADPTVAPQHCRITFAGGNAAVEDLGSKSGTLVAGALVKPGKPFKVMNKVEIDPGAVTLQFEFLERGTISPTQPLKVRKATPKPKVTRPKTK